MFTRKSSDFLFARPSFLSGVARVIDIGGTFDVYNTSDDPDRIAIKSDWLIVGRDIEEAISCYEDDLEHVG